MFSKSYSNKSENDYISVCTTLFDNIENELILYPSIIGIKDYKDITKTNIFSDRHEKTKTRNTIKFFNGILGAISDEIYDGNRNDYKSFIETCFKNAFPLGGILVKGFFKDNKTSDQFFQQGRKWGKEFYNRYQNNNLAEEQQTPEQRNNKSTQNQAVNKNHKKLAIKQKVLDHIRHNQQIEKQKEKQKEKLAKIERFRQERLAKEERERQKKAKEQGPRDAKQAFIYFIPLILFIIFMNLI